VKFLSQVGAYLTSGAQWSGMDGIPNLLANQVEISALAVVAAVIAGVGAGAVLGHTRRGGFAVLNAANAARAVPSFALITLLGIQPAIVRLPQGGLVATGIAMWALAVPPILTNAYVGVQDVDPEVRTAAIAMGMKPAQAFWKVELPLAMPLIMAGARTASVEVVATATLGAYVGFNDLGTLVFSGLALHNDVETFSGALLVAVLALAVDALMALTARALTPAGVRASAAQAPRWRQFLPRRAPSVRG
jgi:osmoprotectant transport system permease protein